MQQTCTALRTSALWDQLFSAPTLENFLDHNESEIHLPPFPEYINTLCRECGKYPAQVIKLAGIERAFGYQIFRGDRKPSRDTVLMLAFGFEANVETAQRLLKHARHSLLYPRVRRDVVIAYGLCRGMSLTHTQIALAELELPAIGAMPK